MNTTPVPADAAYAPPPRRTRTTPRQSEADLTNSVLALLRGLPQTYARKVHGGAMGNAGEPDIDASAHGRAVKIELKRPGSSAKPGDAQRAALKRWHATGALCGWARSLEHVLQLLEHVGDPAHPLDLDRPGCSCPAHGAVSEVA